MSRARQAGGSLSPDPTLRRLAGAQLPPWRYVSGVNGGCLFRSVCRSRRCTTDQPANSRPRVVCCCRQYRVAIMYLVGRGSPALWDTIVTIRRASPVQAVTTSAILLGKSVIRKMLRTPVGRPPLSRLHATFHRDNKHYAHLMQALFAAALLRVVVWVAPYLA